MEIGDRITNRRKELKLTQDQLAKLSGLSRVSIGNYERGDRVPDVESTQKIAKALGVTANDLIYGDYHEEHMGETIRGIEESKKNIIDFANSYDEFDDYNDLHYVSQFVDLIKKKNKEIIKYEELWHEERYARLKLEEEKNK
ncbi:helix-turn-helix domain-containing protein [Lysinibacillus sp. LZ02]|uniref:helix-turn-helix domain-containing protein n=1 Tax=Lysinibacillus sp. LZ02 TaxID=3420668 RepID=UPI003D35DF0B